MAASSSVICFYGGTEKFAESKRAAKFESRRLYQKPLKDLMKAYGFTLIEMVVTMIIIGVLALVAIPKVFDFTDFDNRRFNDEVMAALQYGHKTAIAARRNVCVTFTSNSVRLMIAGAPGNAQGCDLNLAGPNGTTPFTVTAPGATVFTAVPANFFFDALGRSSVGAQTIQVAGTSASIRVEQESGYVHP